MTHCHQLRGRVGRGAAKSFCVALHGDLTDEARQRLEVFGATDDGFRIAEADLEIRGPGDLLGTRQAGEPLFRVANIVADREWLEKSRRDARELLETSAGEAGLSPFLRRLDDRVKGRYQRFAGG